VPPSAAVGLDFCHGAPFRLHTTVEDPALSEISARLQLQAIYRRFTGNRVIPFFGSMAAAVGWVERNAKPIGWGPLMGFAALDPSYTAQCKRPVAVAGVRAHTSETRISANPILREKASERKKRSRYSRVRRLGRAGAAKRETGAASVPSVEGRVPDEARSPVQCIPAFSIWIRPVPELGR
jgi:hypothetical protein